jgi:hypothetical protein
MAGSLEESFSFIERIEQEGEQSQFGMRSAECGILNRPGKYGHLLKRKADFGRQKLDNSFCRKES